ncbi:MAG: hypothetical protein ABIQ66_08300 [Novosphingobium sp.]
MSRAMNIQLTEAEVSAKCATAGVIISAIEPLLSGGTHLVCRTSEGADEMRVRFKTNMIEGRVKRAAFYVPRDPR